MEVKETNKVVTSADEILLACRELASQNGLKAVNIRSVAKKCNIAIGSIYHYYPSKEDLMIATVESLWKSIFHEANTCGRQGTFLDNVQRFYLCAYKGAAEYPSFFTQHSLSFSSSEKPKGKQHMTEYFEHMKAGLLKALQEDEGIHPSAFTEAFSKNGFVDFVFSSMITLLLQQQPNCDLLLEVIRRSVYERVTEPTLMGITNKDNI